MGYCYIDVGTLLLDGIGADRARTGLIALAGGEFEPEGMQRADDGIAREHAFGQGSALVGTTVIDGKYVAPAGAEKGDLAAGDGEGATEADGKVIE
jgi:hypothetical protein